MEPSTLTTYSNQPQVTYTNQPQVTYTNQPQVIRRSYNQNSLPVTTNSTATYTTTTQSGATRTVGEKQVIRYVQDANGNLTQISGPP